MSIYIFVLLASFFIPIHLNGQQSIKDTTKADIEFIEDVVKKLESEDAAEIVKFIDQLLYDREQAVRFADTSRSVAEMMPVVVFVFLLIVIFLPFYFNFKKVRGRQIIINNLIEKGKEIPDELLSPSSTRTARSDLHKGVILFSLGLGICIVILVLNIADNYWTLGLIPIFIAIGYFISFKFDKPADII